MRLEYYQGERNCAAFSPDGGRFATGARSGTVQVCETDSGRLLATLHGHRGTVYCVAFSPDGQTLATRSKDSTARLWDVGGSEELATLDAGGYVRSVAFSPDGKSLAVGGNDGAVRLWDVVALRRDRVVERVRPPVGPEPLARVRGL